MKTLDGYRRVKLKDLAESIDAGGTPRRDVKEYWNGGDIPWLKISDLKSVYINDSQEKITRKGLESSSAKMFPQGTVLFSIFATLGATGILEKPSTSNQAIAGIVPKRQMIDTKYLYYSLVSQRNSIIAKKTHATQDNINLSILRNHEIVLPPLEIQKRIVSILEKAEQLKQWRKDSDKLTNDYLTGVFLEMFGDPVNNPKKWITKKLKHLCSEILGGGTPSKAKPQYYLGKIPWVTPKDMKEEYISDSIDHISEKAIRESSTKLVPKNSLLMVIRSGILKKKLPVAINLREVTINQDMKAFVFKEGSTNPVFMLHFFIHYQRHLLKRIRSVTADNLEFGMIKNIDVISPQVALQNDFAKVAEQVRKLAELQTQSRNQIRNLFEVLMQKSFGDELTC